MDYYLFIDESGDHGLTNIDPSYPIFVLCGVLFKQTSYVSADASIKQLKNKFWQDGTVILHSSDIRKQRGAFVKLIDQKVKQEFYEGLNDIISNSDYCTIATVIKKEDYIKKYGKLTKDIYSISLSNLIERAVFFIDDEKETSKKLCIIIEERGKKEDAQLRSHFNDLILKGTGHVTSSRLKALNININFRKKSQDINGLQISDLVAYPIARHILSPTSSNPAYSIIEKKFYCKRGKSYGLIVRP